MFIVRRRRLVIGVWLVLTIVGVVASGQLSSRWYQSSAVPGGPAYEAGQRALAAFGTGARAPNVVVFHTAGDATRSRAIAAAMRRAAAAVPGARTSSYFSTGNPMYLSRDRHTTFQVVYPPGAARLDRGSSAERMRAAARAGLPAGIGVDVTGRDALDEATKHGAGGGSSVLVEAVIGGVGALRRPAVRVRDAARGPDAARRRGRRDLQHLHARVGADLRHRASRSSSSS